MCDEPDPMYIPSDDVEDYGLYSCECGFEMEGPREKHTLLLPTAAGLEEPLTVEVILAAHTGGDGGSATPQPAPTLTPAGSAHR
ncbi:hypothetical protein ACPW96_21625 [Micromonospora sp. DT81.3]|uniref:hypothetical protein n=1 Tax=Micromonospora sp. DT81.3 TaxID=3416523 RepID=UPI003CF3E7D3